MSASPAASARRDPIGRVTEFPLGLLLPDPCDRHCPREFKREARGLLPRVQGQPDGEDRELRQAMRLAPALGRVTAREVLFPLPGHDRGEPQLLRIEEIR